MRISFFSTLFFLLTLSSCINSKIDVSLKESESLKGLNVQSITFDNNQITVTGKNLNGIKNVKIKDGAQVSHLSIISKNSTTLILSSLSPVVLNAEKLLDLIFSNANASVVQPISFSMCQATLNSIKFDCSVPPNQNEVLSYDTTKGWTPKSMNGLSYKGTWNPTTTPMPTGSSYAEGDYLLVAATISPYFVGDWLVSDGTDFEHVSNSSAIVNVFGRTGAVVPEEGDYLLNQLDDVVITSPTTNQVLTFNGTHWVNSAPAAGGGGGPSSTSGLPEGSNLYFTTARTLNTQIGSVTPSNSTITSTDTIKSSLEKLQGQVSAKLNAIFPAGTISDYLRGNNTYSDFGSDVRSTPLTSLPSISNPIISSSDSVIEAFEKLHAPLVNLNQSALTNLGGSLLAGTISGIPTPFNDNDAANKKYVDDNISGGGAWQINSNDVYRAAGKVGIGNSAPSAVLDVTGDIVSRVYDNSSSSNFDFSRSNIQYTTSNCSNYSISNLQNGGNYQIIIQGTTASLCNFSSTQSLTFRFYPDNDLTMANTHTIYSLTRVGNFVYVSWITGI